MTRENRLTLIESLKVAFTGALYMDTSLFDRITKSLKDTPDKWEEIDNTHIGYEYGHSFKHKEHCLTVDSSSTDCRPGIQGHKLTNEQKDILDEILDKILYCDHSEDSLLEDI